MSKGKDAQAVKAVLDYLNKQNRPYSAIDIVNNLHKEYGKTNFRSVQRLKFLHRIPRNLIHLIEAVVKACESLAESGKIKEKVNGKQKVYVADQSQFAEVNDSEIKDMDVKITQLTEEVKLRSDEVRRLEVELKGLNSSMSTEEARNVLLETERECSACNEKLVKLKEGGNTISPQEKDQIYNMRKVYVKEWRKRKRISNDILGAILEGYPKTKKQLYEDIGIETDEEYNVTPPDI